ncbi:hypothetical protein CK497_07595 [Vreelandella alkaliphila]|uniref:Uncharacterized protein n=1 Tax=Vreelandella alkaliphila TaxID=272774 RepID=A0ABX4HKU1_9GAMM|nr:hypothetical protein CK497_07595 [Halomonas humidisoli]
MIHINSTTTLNFTNAHFFLYFGKLSVYNAIGIGSLDAKVANVNKKVVIGASGSCLQKIDV